MDNQQGPPVRHMELCSGLRGSWMGGEFGGARIHVYVWLRPLAVHLKLAQHCLLSAIPQYKIKSFKKKKSFRMLLNAPLPLSFQKHQAHPLHLQLCPTSSLSLPLHDPGNLLPGAPCSSSQPLRSKWYSPTTHRTSQRLSA